MESVKHFLRAASFGQYHTKLYHRDKNSYRVGSTESSVLGDLITVLLVTILAVYTIYLLWGILHLWVFTLESTAILFERTNNFSDFQYNLFNVSLWCVSSRQIKR
jgi:hypothetical protein